MRTSFSWEKIGSGVHQAVQRRDESRPMKTQLPVKYMAVQLKV